MPRVWDIIDIMEKIAPPECAYEGDKIGLMLGDRDCSVDTIVCCLDVTARVADQAIECGAQMIISHHPLIFEPLPRIVAEIPECNTLIKLIRQGISVYSAHTNMDFCKGGINDYLAELFGLCEVETLHLAGVVGSVGKEISIEELAMRVERALGGGVRLIAHQAGSRVQRVAILGGGGGGDTEYVDKAIDAGADAFVTADVKHHVGLYARARALSIIEPTHYQMEHPYVHRLKQRLDELLDNKIRIICSED